MTRLPHGLRNVKRLEELSRREIALRGPLGLVYGFALGMIVSLTIMVLAQVS